MLTLLIILLVVAVLFGGWGGSRYGPYGWSPLGLLLVLFLILYLTGNLNL